MSSTPFSTGQSCAIIGSFRKHYNKILELSREFETIGIKVLTPKLSKIVNPDEDFVLLESDCCNGQYPSISHIEDQVLSAILDADFVYVCNPDGYIGLSTSFEIGYALSRGISIYSLEAPQDTMLSQYFKQCIPQKIECYSIENKINEVKSHG